MGNGKVYLIQVSDKQWAAIADAVEGEFHGVRCITGSALPKDPSRSWVTGSTVFVPVSRILQALVYGSQQEYAEALRRWSQSTDIPPREP